MRVDMVSKMKLCLIMPRNIYLALQLSWINKLLATNVCSCQSVTFFCCLYRMSEWSHEVSKHHDEAKKILR